MKRTFSLILCVIVLFTCTISSVSALKGTDVWEDDGYVEYEIDVYVNWNCVYYPDTDSYPNFDIQKAIYKTTFRGMDEDKMDFKASTPSNALSTWRALFGYEDTRKVDPDTGLDEEGIWYGAFYDTSDFNDGFEVSDLAYYLEYEDDNGIHTISEPWTVTGSKKTSELEINGVKTNISVWDGTVDDFYIVSTVDNYDYRTEYQGFIEQVSDPNGVLMRSSITRIDKLKVIGEYVTLMSMNYSSEAIKISGVNVMRKDASIPGFELLSPVMLLLILFFYRKKRKVP